jgi:hypothetical protein
LEKDWLSGSRQPRAEVPVIRNPIPPIGLASVAAWAILIALAFEEDPTVGVILFAAVLVGFA